MATYRVKIKGVDSVSVAQSGGVQVTITVDADNPIQAQQQATEKFLQNYPTWTAQNVIVQSVSLERE